MVVSFAEAMVRFLPELMVVELVMDEVSFKSSFDSLLSLLPLAVLEEVLFS